MRYIIMFFKNKFLPNRRTANYTCALIYFRELTPSIPGIRMSIMLLYAYYTFLADIFKHKKILQ